MNKATGSAILILSALVIMSCTTQRIGQFKTFASAGKSYTDAVVGLLQEAGNVAVDADNEFLTNNRDKFSQDKRIEAYSGHTGELREYFRILNDFRTHTLLLSDYFSTLASLADQKTGEGIGSKAESIVKELAKLRPSLENARIGDATVRDFLGKSVPLTVTYLRQGALEAELRQNAATIGLEIDLQVALVSALASGIKSDLEVLSNFYETNTVARPFVSDANLPATWKKDRKGMLTLSSSALQAANTEKAARELKNAFTALVENKASSAGFNALFSDINSMIDFIETIRKNNPNNSK